MKSRRRQPSSFARARGYQILKLESMTPTQTMPFEQAREQISERVFTDKRQGGVREVSREAAGAGDHRVEERGRQEGLRTGPEAAGGAAGALTGFVDPDIPDPESPNRSGSPSGRGRGTSRSSASSSSASSIDAFLPTITRWSRWKDRKKKIDWPLFPGYCFARFDPADTLPDPEVHRRRQHRVVRGQAGADSRLRARQHPRCSSAASCSTIRAR